MSLRESWGMVSLYFLRIYRFTHNSHGPARPKSRRKGTPKPRMGTIQVTTSSSESSFSPSLSQPFFFGFGLVVKSTGESSFSHTFPGKISDFTNHAPGDARIGQFAAREPSNAMCSNNQYVNNRRSIDGKYPINTHCSMDYKLSPFMD